jgi:hypothetical protein
MWLTWMSRTMRASAMTSDLQFQRTDRPAIFVPVR